MIVYADDTALLLTDRVSDWWQQLDLASEI